MLALAVFTTAGTCSIYPAVAQKVDVNIWINMIAVIEVLLGLTAILVTKLATMPYLDSEGSSLIYFGNVSELSDTEFTNRSSQMTGESELVDLRGQVRMLAKGLKKKFIRLRWATCLLLWQFILFFPLFFLLIINLKP